MHVGRELWQALQIGYIFEEEIIAEIFLHGLTCERCREEYQAHEAGEGVLVVWPREKDWQPPLEVEKQIRELERHRPEERLPKIEQARTRFRGRDFIVALIRRIRELKESNLSEASEWVSCAVASAEGTHGRVGSQLKILTLAETCDVCTRLGDHDAAWRALREARFVEEGTRITFEKQGVPLHDPHIMAIAYLYQGRHWAKLGHHLAAYRFLFRARLLFRIIREGEPCLEAEDEFEKLKTEIWSQTPPHDLQLLFLISQGLASGFGKKN